jgi:hypothetical protein
MHFKDLLLTRNRAGSDLVIAMGLKRHANNEMLLFVREVFFIIFDIGMVIILFSNFALSLFILGFVTGMNVIAAGIVLPLLSLKLHQESNSGISAANL